MADLLSELLEDYLLRRSAGETPHPEDYRERAGDCYADFVELLAGESAMDAALGVETETPIPADFGDYTLLAELGRGAVGVVYEALHRNLDRNVAVKILRTGFDTSPEAIERFRREAIACAQAQHDNVVEVYESGEVDGRPYYAMTLVKGSPLSELIRRGSAPAPPEACRRLAGVADALHTLHEQGILHRDIKPSNIMVEETGRMVLADFGLARTLVSAALTKSGDALGTPLYMSPEQIMGRTAEINRRSDVYGLGATLYEVVAGRPPFAAGELETLIQRILKTRPQPLRALDASVPVDCERIVLKALEKENRDRYETAAAMRDDLLAFAEGRSTSGRPVSELVRRARWAKRRWRELAVAATVLIVGGVLFFTRPATLRVDCYPVAEVFVDGKRRGPTPQEFELSAGRHELTLRSSGFVASNERLDLRAGEVQTLRVVLIAGDPDDPAALQKLARKFELAIATLDRTRNRGVLKRKGAVPMLPRGLVRSADIRLRVDVDADFDAKGALVFKAGDTRIHSQPFDPEFLTSVLPMPAAVKEAVKTGQEIEWGFYPAGSKVAHVTSKFRLATDDLGPQLEAIATALDKQDARLVANMRANLFLEHGLFHAAFVQATVALKSGPNEHACAIMQAALRGMKLDGTPMWTELFAHVDKLR